MFTTNCGFTVGILPRAVKFTRGSPEKYGRTENKRKKWKQRQNGTKTSGCIYWSEPKALMMTVGTVERHAHVESSTKSEWMRTTTWHASVHGRGGWAGCRWIKWTTWCEELSSPVERYIMHIIGNAVRALIRAQYLHHSRQWAGGWKDVRAWTDIYMVGLVGGLTLVWPWLGGWFWLVWGGWK